MKRARSIVEGMEYKDKDWLFIKYITERLTCKQIAHICGCHERTIHQRLTIFNIPRRVSGFNSMPEEDKQRYRDEKRKWALAHPEMNKMKGKHHSAQTRLRMSLMRKQNPPNWKGGISPQNALERTRVEYDNWRRQIFERDNYTCQSCGRTGNKVYLNAHHVLPFAEYPEARLVLNNGITLCKLCHELVTQENRIGHPFRGNKYVKAKKDKPNKQETACKEAQVE